MSNEAYLIVSYSLVVPLCAALAIAAYLWLRNPAEGIAVSLPHEGLRKTIRRAFPLSTVLFALSWCLSVSYYGCSQKKYDDIVKDRSYITSKNTEQVSEALQGVIWSVALWSAIFAIALRATRGRSST
ncbi:MAG TPA: hypothetical protein VJN89_19190 [Candidatus Acidoferrum sp.]|nr:hypothetical protein [Candidatus Acidoferrum sp.]